MAVVKAIIFDMDDTLIDTTGVIRDQLLLKSVETMIHAGLKSNKEEAFSTIKELALNPRKDRFEELCKKFEAGKEVAEAGRKAYFDAEVDLKNLELMPFVEETLLLLKERYKLALVSLGNRKLQEKKIEHLKLKRYFDHIHISDKETKEQCFLGAVETLGIKPGHIMAVGDRIDVDVKAANKLGLISVRVMHGSYKHVKIEDEFEKPNYQVDSVAEIPSLIEMLEEEETKLEKGPRIVAIGGGTGLPTLLEGLKNYTYNLSAIVTITDEGRSSGMLRKELHILPPGDIRNNMVALSNSEQKLLDLFQYRFSEGSLEGHTVGNLLIAALTKMNNGNFEAAIQELSRILNLKGSVHPSALEDTHVCAELYDGMILNNEQEIVLKGDRLRTRRSPVKKVFLNPEKPKHNPAAVEKILQAELVVIGPGSLVTSVIPNLLIPEIYEALAKTKAKIVYVSNIVTHPGQTESFTACDHVRMIKQYVKRLDYAIINKQRPSRHLEEEYGKENAFFVENDSLEIRKLGVEPMEEELLEDLKEKKILWEKQYLLRHDSRKIAKILIGLVGIH